MSLPQADTTYSSIETKVRRLTGSSSNASLTSDEIAKRVNLFYNNDFPYAIKLDQTRQIYKFFTIPNVDRYPVDVNNWQGFRAPVYIEGIPANFFKNREQLFNLYPRYPSRYPQGIESISGTITGIAQPTNPCEITSPDHGLATGAQIIINNVGGMVELNGNVYTITVVDANTFTLNGIDNTPYGAYTSGGTWSSASANLNFTLFGTNVNPFPQPNYGILSTQVVIGGIDINGNPIRIVDDGGAITDSDGIGSNTTTGRLLFINTNNVGANVYLNSSNKQIAAIPPLSPLGGGNAYYDAQYPAYPPNPLTPQYCGTVNYVTSEFSLTLPVTPMPGTQLNVWAAQYQVGRPYNVLFWNNELTIRPVPDNVYQVEIECYQTPIQFMNTSDNPLINQWSQYIAYGVALEILRDRQDMEGVQNLMEGFKRQEALVLERQAIEEISIPQITLFNSTQIGYAYGVGTGYGQGF